MPQATDINSSFTLLDLARQKEATFSVIGKIGDGSFGQTYHIKSPDYQERLVCKEIDLQGKTKYIHYTHFQLLRFTYREIDYLQQLGLLVGYQHDEINHKMLIVMKYLPGIEEYEIAPKLRMLAEYASFCALRNLHRHGVAHMDPHQGNFLFDEKNKHAHAIDFGFAQDAHFFRQLRDFHVFLKLRRTPPTFLSKEGRATLWYFIDFYCTELRDYILAHKYETAQTVFCYAAVIIAAMCGASVLGIASLLAQELIKAMILPALSQLLEALQEHYEMRAINQRMDASYRYFYYCLSGTMIVLQGFLLALQVMALQNCFTDFFTQISTLSDVCVNNQAFWQSCINAFPVEETIKTLIHLRPWSHTLQYWYNNAEKYLFTKELIISSYLTKISENAKQNTYLPLYKQSATPATPPNNAVQSHDCIRSSALPQNKLPK